MTTLKTLSQDELDLLFEDRLVKQRAQLDRNFAKAVRAHVAERARLDAENTQLRADLDRLRAENTTLRAELDDLWPRPRPSLSTRLRRWFTSRRTV